MQNQEIKTDKQLLKRMKKSVVKPIGRTIGSFRSLAFLSTTQSPNGKTK